MAESAQAADPFGQSFAYYARLPAEHWGDVLGDCPSRPPRIMLITSRFSSYMKFSTRDLASTFRRMGWQVHVLTESSAAERLSANTVSEAVAAFLPDLIWQINYARSDWPQAIPDGVPFVCWDQDSMAHLASRQQAGRMGRFDFLACMGNGVGYIRRHGYAADRLIGLPACVDRSIFHPDAASVADTDVSYVSHHGCTLDEQIEKIIGTLVEGNQRLLRPALREYAARLENQFWRDGDPLTRESSGRVLSEVLRRRRLDLPPEAFNPLRNCAYLLVANSVWRQQVIRQAISCRVGLALYGLGWDTNPPFRRFARGIVEHGEPLAEAFRSSRVALQVILTGNDHQRLWEAAACGAPVLMRYHPEDECSAVIRGWVGDLETGTGQPLEQVVVLPNNASLAQRFSWQAIRWLAEDDGLLTDQVLQYAHRIAATPCLRDKLGGAVYDEVSFRTPQQFRSRLDRLLHDQAARTRVCQKLQEAVEQHDYGVQVPRVIREVRQRLLACRSGHCPGRPAVADSLAAGK